MLPQRGEAGGKRMTCNRFSCMKSIKKPTVSRRREWMQRESRTEKVADKVGERDKLQTIESTPSDDLKRGPQDGCEQQDEIIGSSDSKEEGHTIVLDMPMEEDREKEDRANKEAHLEKKKMYAEKLGAGGSELVRDKDVRQQVALYAAERKRQPPIDMGARRACIGRTSMELGQFSNVSDQMLFQGFRIGVRCFLYIAGSHPFHLDQTTSASARDIDNSNCGFPSECSVMDVQTKSSSPKVNGKAKRMEECIKVISEMFTSMNDGKISLSAYDTAWVALVPALDGSAGPQFPKLLQWIIENQLFDGSWGDNELFLAYDHVCITLACILALKTWNTGHANVERGLEFLRSNIAKIETEKDDYMPIGFEIVFPAMLEDPKDLALDLPYESATLKQLKKEREIKLKRSDNELL